MKRELNAFWRVVSGINGVLLTALAVDYIFNLSFFGITMPENSYLYLLLALSLLQVYILYPLASRFSAETLWLDAAFALTGLIGCGYLAVNGLSITAEGWMILPPNESIVWLSIVLTFVVLEALRRVAGITITIVCAVFVFFPIVADRMPEVIFGNSFTFSETMTMHVLDSQGLVGIPLRVTGTLLIGFIIFGVVLSRTGGARFFLDTASVIMGRQRGGGGKIATVASALFGSMSGSSISNVITTGSVTIPAMKASGFKPSTAGAIEACASTGGMIMPPVMGAVAFLMAQFLNISYFDVVIAAFLPSLLYYVGMLVLIDVYAVRHGIGGVSEGHTTTAWTVMRNGWPFVVSLLFLVYLLYLRLEAYAPFVAFTFILFAMLALRRFRVSELWSLAVEISGAVSELIVTLAAVGFIISAMSMTGVGSALSGELIRLAGNNAYLLLAMGAATSFVLGMGLTASACYIFLAVVLAPALVAQGFNEIAVHLFILYWAIISNITPPVALACFPAAKIAGAGYFKVCFSAVLLGFSFYIVPFAFVFNPALVLQTGGWLILPHALFAILGVVITAYGIGRYVPGLGPISLAASVPIAIGGVAVLSLTDFTFKIAALLAVLLLAAAIHLTGMFKTGCAVPNTSNTEPKS